LAQANWLAGALRTLHPDHTVELVTIRTAGDRFVDRSLRAIGGKGLFVKEIEDALLAGDIDCAIHSMKDVPAEIPTGLVIAAVPRRADAGDVLITRRGGGLDTLGSGATVGTSSLRRMSLLRSLRADLHIIELRGNVDTRLRRLEAGDFDGIVLAAAGLQRLGLQLPNATTFDIETFLPAIGQGALAIETRLGDAAAYTSLEDAETRDTVVAERAFLARVGGSCHTPIAAHAQTLDTKLTLHALIARPDGTSVIRGEVTGDRRAGVQLGDDLGLRLLDAGGGEIIAEVLRAQEAGT
jgi:hydroxymethylbilane synthase